MTLWFWAKFLVCVWLGAASLRWLAGRATHDGRLRRITLGSFGLRALVGVALYAVSYYHWPILRSLQLQGGFWSLGPDADLYHAIGAQIAEAWTHGTELPDVGTDFEFYALVAAVYWLLGAHPLYVILLNGWLGALTGGLAYRIGARLFDQRAALTGAFLISFWLSSLIWSSQLLKEALCWFLILMVVWLVILLAEPDTRPRRTRRALQAAGLAGCTLLLTRLRPYLGSALVVAAVATLVPSACWTLVVRHRIGRAVRLAGLAMLAIGCVVAARGLDITPLISPAHPEQGHVRLGLSHQRRGAPAQAEREFRRAIALRPDDRAAYLALAALLVEQERLQEALELYVSAPGAAGDATIRERAERLAARLGEAGEAPAPPQALEDFRSAAAERQAVGQVRVGRRQWQQGESAKARATFQSAEDLHPEAAAVYLGLGTAFVERELLMEALEVCVSAPGGLADPSVRQLLDHLMTPRDQGAPVPPPGPGLALEPFLSSVSAERQALGQVRVGRLQWQQGERARAEVTFRRAIALRPDDRAAYLALAALLVEQERLQEALELYGSAPGAAGEATIRELLGHLAARLVEEPKMPAPPPGPAPRPAAAAGLLSELRPGWLGSLRGSFIAGGGHAVMDAQENISQPHRLLSYLPRAVLVGFLAPFPSQWLDTRGSTRSMRVVAGLEMLLCVYPLLVGLALSFWRAIRQPGRVRRAWRAISQAPVGLGFLLAYGLVVAVAASLVVANLGTLFRLRLLYWLPLLILVAAGDPLGGCRWFADRLTRWRSALRLLRPAGET